MNIFKRCNVIILSILIIIITPLSVEAKVNTMSLKEEGFPSLSEVDKKDTIRYLVKEISNDLSLSKTPSVYFYYWPENEETAYANEEDKTICVNMSRINDPTVTFDSGYTIEYYVVSTIAHEVRHIYQFEHENDDTDYGKALYDNLSNYQDYFKVGYELYNNQFVEIDARKYGEDFADNYCKTKYYLNPTILITDDNKIFDPVFYANTYPDVKDAIGTDPVALMNHYNTFGINENRKVNIDDK